MRDIIFETPEKNIPYRSSDPELVEGESRIIENFIFSTSSKNKIRHFFRVFTFTVLMLISSAAESAIAKGSLKGPYFLVNGGASYFAADNNVRTGAQVGRNFEPSGGFHFGWNIFNQFAPELEARYTTNRNGGNREHIATLNVNAVYSIILKKLTDFKKVKILPFLQAGPVIQLASLPGDPESTDGVITTWGQGFGFGGGVRFLIKTYFYLGALAQLDFVSFPDKFQTVGGASTKIISGGWKTEPAFSGNIGVHF